MQQSQSATWKDQISSQKIPCTTIGGWWAHSVMNINCHTGVVRVATCKDSAFWKRMRSSKCFQDWLATRRASGYKKNSATVIPLWNYILSLHFPPSPNPVWKGHSGMLSTVWVSSKRMQRSGTNGDGEAMLKLKSFPSHQGPYGGTEFRFYGPQPDTSWSCKSVDMGLVCHVECLFSSQLAPVPIYTALNRGICVSTTCPELLRGAERPGLEPATSRLQVRCPNHYAIAPCHKEQMANLLTGHTRHTVVKQMQTYSAYLYSHSPVMWFRSNNRGTHSIIFILRSRANFLCSSSSKNFSCVAVCWSAHMMASLTRIHSLQVATATSYDSLKKLKYKKKSSWGLTSLNLITLLNIQCKSLELVCPVISCTNFKLSIHKI